MQIIRLSARPWVSMETHPLRNKWWSLLYSEETHCCSDGEQGLKNSVGFTSQDLHQADRIRCSRDQDGRRVSSLNIRTAHFHQTLRTKIRDFLSLCLVLNQLSLSYRNRNYQTRMSSKSIDDQRLSASSNYCSLLRKNQDIIRARHSILVILGLQICWEKKQESLLNCHIVSPVVEIVLPWSQRKMCRTQAGTVNEEPHIFWLQTQYYLERWEDERSFIHRSDI